MSARSLSSKALISTVLRLVVVAGAIDSVSKNHRIRSAAAQLSAATIDFDARELPCPFRIVGLVGSSELDRPGLFY